MTMTLIPIGEDSGTFVGSEMNAEAEGVIAFTHQNYKRVGFEPPWIGYMCFVDAVNVGTCGFKGPPTDGVVEIAYFTFPEFEGNGFAGHAAEALIGIARSANRAVLLTAQTLPAEGPSPRILSRLGFIKEGSRLHPEDGEVWHWVLEGDGDGT